MLDHDRWPLFHQTIKQSQLFLFPARIRSIAHKHQINFQILIISHLNILLSISLRFIQRLNIQLEKAIVLVLRRSSIGPHQHPRFPTAH